MTSTTTTTNLINVIILCAFWSIDVDRKKVRSDLGRVTISRLYMYLVHRIIHLGSRRKFHRLIFYVQRDRERERYGARALKPIKKNGFRTLRRKQRLRGKSTADYHLPWAWTMDEYDGLSSLSANAIKVTPMNWKCTHTLETHFFSLNQSIRFMDC